MSSEIDGSIRYTQMQKKFYDESHETEEVIVGSYDFHENFPYETHLLYRYGDIRRPVFDRPDKMIGIDVGCGEGRMIRRMSKLLKRVDGCDISEKMAKAARERCPSSNIYVTTGANCGEAKSNSYDFAYNTISLHHICVYDLRAAILTDITRILKIDGCATLQFFFGKHYPFCPTLPPMKQDYMMIQPMHADRLMAGWFENRHDAKGTNSVCDVAFGTTQIPNVISDFQRWFESVEFWFHDMSIGRPDPRGDRTPRYLPETHPNCHGLDNSWFTHAAFFHLRGPKKA